MDQSTRILLSLFEFLVTVVLSVLVVYVNYRLFIATNKDYDAEEELKKGNMGVATLLAALLIASGYIVKNGVYPVINLTRLFFTNPEHHQMAGWMLIAHIIGHLLLVFIVAVFSISFSLRFYGRLTRGISEGAELKKGNAAVGVVLAAVVLVVAMYVSDGVSSLTKSLIPQADIGSVSTVHTMR